MISCTVNRYSKAMSEVNIPIVDQSEIELENLPIGRGGYGTVYRGKHRQFGHVAVKTLINNGQLPKKHLDVLQAEAKKLMEFCEHDGILHLYGLIMQRDNYSLILEYMPLGSLIDFRKQFSPQFPLYVRFLMEVSSAMDFLHSRIPTILHLDLKADNILLDGDMHAKVSDFGLSEWKTVTMTATRRTDQSDSSGRRCTVSHVPPEVWSNINTPSDRFYDIYSFAICVWEMLTGAVPYGNARDDLIRSAVLSGQRPDFSLIPTGCPPFLTKLMTRCWHQKPTQRPSFGTLKKEIEEQYNKEFKRDIITALKNVRREIKESFTPDNLIYIYTNHIDHINEPQPAQNTSPKQQGSDQSSSASTSRSASTSTHEQSISQGPQTPEVMETEDEGPVQSVLFKKELEMSSAEKTFRKILRDPLALLVARTNYCNSFFSLDSKYSAILNDDEKLKRYLDEDELFKKEILCPGNDFWGNISGTHLRMAKERGRAWKEANAKELDNIARAGRYGKTDSWNHRNQETPRTERRRRVEKTFADHPHITELKKGGNYYRVKKALENPRMFETLLRSNDAAPESNPLSLTTLDPEVIKLAKDPVLLLALLHTEYSLLSDLMKPENQELLMKVFGDAKQKYPLPGGGYITKPSSRRGYPMGMFHDHDMMMMLDMMGGPDPMMMRRHMMDSDEDDDHPTMGGGLRGLHRIKEMFKPSRKDSGKK
ncbi:receptor-interacting serine/threonine-protein kinase 3-like isoform X2 [Saccostrea echinata]|uniref:receptor-interacting serine/threonine-protein kinase 3-like isoform X2 n=1 Tax=Saccostrea echinata TaxID=191078 RepID=UPI002A8152DE|nr:receptor-interacting serine/threonine-protein kinase 3-like isoform X2 [Saccostrea echinata]